MPRAIKMCLLTTLLALVPVVAEANWSASNARNRIMVSFGSSRAWRRVRTLSYRYLVHAYSQSGTLLWQRTERHALRRHRQGWELRVEFCDGSGDQWVAVKGRSRQWVRKGQVSRSWLDLPSDLRLRLSIDTFCLDHPCVLKERGTRSRYIGVGRIRGKDTFVFNVDYSPKNNPPVLRSRLDFLIPEGWLHRLRCTPIDSKAGTWDIHFSHQLPTGRFRIPLRREYHVNDLLWRKTLITDIRFNQKLPDNLFQEPSHPVR